MSAPSIKAVIVIRPQLALKHDRLDGVVHALRRVSVLFEKLLYHHPHLCSGGIALLPVNCAIAAEGVCQFFCNGDEFFVLVKILDSLRFCQGIIECQLIGCQTKLFAKARSWIRLKKLTFADQSALIRSTTKRKVLPQRYNDQKFLHPHTIVRHFSKRLFWMPYPHTDNIKQWHIEKVHTVFKYHQFDDILEEYLTLKENFNARI